MDNIKVHSVRSNLMLFHRYVIDIENTSVCHQITSKLSVNTLLLQLINSVNSTLLAAIPAV